MSSSTDQPIPAEPPAAVVCAACGETVPSAEWCESCGGDLATAGGACVDPTCGASPDQLAGGFCQVCGLAQPGRRDHIEIDRGWVAGITDRGVVRKANEDAFAIETWDEVAVVCVCDGVASAPGSADISEVAAITAAETVLEAVRTSNWTELSDDDRADVLDEATERAQAATLSAGQADSANAPASTYVLAVLSPGVLDVAWLGDSRAYWINEFGPELLTSDHNHRNAVAEAQPDLGAAQLAELANGAALVRYLGPDGDGEPPEIVHFDPGDAPGMVVVCSDGLSMYDEEGTVMADAGRKAAASFPPSERGLVAARAASLVEFALASGGGDNVTVVIADSSHAASESESTRATSTGAASTGDEAVGHEAAGHGAAGDEAAGHGAAGHGAAGDEFVGDEASPAPSESDASGDVAPDAEPSARASSARGKGKAT